MELAGMAGGQRPDSATSERPVPLAGLLAKR